jgi:dTDP-4-dehydrorhamnose reductase
METSRDGWRARRSSRCSGASDTVSEPAARTLVTGASGILGDALLRSARFAGALGVVHEQDSPHEAARADLRDPVATAAALAAAAPAVVVHTVGLTDVDACESAPAAAYATSVLTTLNVADWIRVERPEALLVYISSDQVYSGPGPHDESRPAPANAYGAAKHAGELAASRAPRHLVLRTNFVGRSGGARASYSDWLLAAARRGEAIPVDPAARFSPLHLRDLVALIAEAIELGLDGSYNLASRDGIHKLEFARAVAETAEPGAGELVVPADAATPGRAPRESDLRLDVARAEAALGHALPEIADCLAAIAAEAREPVRAA